MANANKKSTAVEKASSRPLTSFEEMDRMFENFFSRGWMDPFRFSRPAWSQLSAPFEGRMPNVDVIDRDNEVFIKAELPGVEKKDMDISMTANTVTIRGKTKKEAKEEKGDYHRCEISQGSFARSLTLPGEVDTDKAKASFKDGVLTLTIPKLKKSKRTSVKID